MTSSPQKQSDVPRPMVAVRVQQTLRPTRTLRAIPSPGRSRIKVTRAQTPAQSALARALVASILKAIESGTNTMRRLSITYALLILAVAQAQNGYDYNRPSKPFDQSSTIKPGGFPVTAPGTYPNGQPSAGGTSSTFPSGPQAGGYPGPNSSPIGSSSSNQGYPGAASTGYPQGERPSKPEYAGQGTSYPGQGGYEQNRPGATIGSYPGQSSGQAGTYPGQGTGQTYPGQGAVQGAGQTYPGQGAVQGAGQTYPGQGQVYPGQGAGQSYPGQGAGQNYPGQGTGGNYQGQIGSGSPSSGAGFIPLGPGIGSQDTGAYEGGDYSAIPGEPDRDYPILNEIPETSFRCDAQAYPGYYADVETRCQVFHICANNRTYDFLCPNGTIFSQQVFVCVWWNQFDCNSAPSLYDLNANLYDYSIMGGGGLSGALGDYSQSPQGSVSLGSTGIQGPSSNYPRPPGQLPGYPGSSESQSPSTGTSIGSQVSSAGYPAAISGQRPSSGFPVTQGTLSGYPSNTGSQGTTGYPGGTNTQGTLPEYPSSSNLQRPSQGYPTTADVQGSLSGYPTFSTQSPAYPSNTGSQGTSSRYPNNNIQSQIPTSQRPNIDNSQGYPSGKPTGPSFPPGPNEGRPSQGSQNGFGTQTQQPNREYLPPRK